MAIIVRRGTVDDAETIAGFALQLFAQHRAYDPDRFARLSDPDGAAWFYGNQTNAPDAAILVAEIDGEIVGFAYLQYEERNYADLLENAARLHDLYVAENARGTGTGKRLMEAAIETGRKFGADKMILSVAAKNEVAREFFDHAGFETKMVEMMLSLADKQFND